jgi:hypothetical protein
MNWKKELEDMKLPDEKELKKFKEQQSPKHSPEFEDWFSRVIGKGFNFTRVELDNMKYSMKYSIQRWRVKGLVGDNELPDTGGRLVWSWKMSFDKQQTINLVKSLSKRISNYRRKMFGMKDGGMNEPYIAHMVDLMMREGMPIRYPDQEMIERFFQGGDLEGIE